MNISVKIIAIVALLAITGLGINAVAQKISYENPSFCSSFCHIMDPYYESYTSTTKNLLALAHAEEDIKCKDCHHTDLSQQMEEIYIMVSGQYETPLSERRVNKETCLSCHEHESYTQIADLTNDLEPNPHDSHWPELECRLCHKMHRQSVDYCDQCHDHGFVVP